MLLGIRKLVQRAVSIGWLALPSALLVVPPAIAQVVADPSLGSTVTLNGNIFEITNGTTVGERNLFHSFSRFDVPSGGVASFLNAPAIANIFARVTGGTPSDIQGMIQAQGTANLFLMNPQGILFGPNAQLNLGGSFISTSANAIRFPNGEEFSQTSKVDTTNPLLSVNPSALFFNQLNPGQITNQSRTPLGTTALGVSLIGLQVPAGQSILFAGGTVTLEGGGMNAPGGRVEIGSVGGIGSIGLEQVSDGWRLQVPSELTRGDVSLQDEATLNVAAAGGGSIAIHARNLEMTGGSFLRAGLDIGAVATIPAGDITLDATGVTRIAGQNTAIANLVRQDSQGNSGAIVVNTGSLAVTDQANFTLGVAGQGNSGNLLINAKDEVLFDRGYVSTSVVFGSTGNSGSIQITGDSLTLQNNAQFVTTSAGKGNAGDILVNVRNAAVFDGSYLFTDVEGDATGNSGKTQINAGSFTLQNGAQFIAINAGQGKAGDVVLNARDRVFLDGTPNSGGFSSSIFSNLTSTGTGQAGTIQISAGSFEMVNRAQLLASSAGKGNAGDVTLDVRDTATLNNSAIFVDSERDAIGNGGTLRINSGSLSLLNRSQFVASARGQGKAGDIVINTRDATLLNESDIFIGVGDGVVGNGGTLQIHTGSLTLFNGAQLVASGRGQGSSGIVTIHARDRVSLDGTPNSGGFSSLITTTLIGVGGDQPGDIRITADSLVLTNGAQINAGISGGKGVAGNIVIQANGAIELHEESSILNRILSAGSGTGGNIEITANSILLSQQSQILTSVQGQEQFERSSQGDAGKITLNVQDTVTLSGRSQMSSNIGRGVVGNGGEITINARAVTVDNQSAISSNSFGQGLAGNITIQVADALVLEKEGGIFSRLEPSGIGRSGDISIRAGSLSLLDTLGISSSTDGNGDGGNISIQVRETTRLWSGLISSLGAGSASGNGGNILLATGSLFLDGESFLGTGNLSRRDESGRIVEKQGNSGNIQITAQDTIALQGRDAFISTSLAQGVIGRSGNIRIDSKTISLSDGASVSASTSGRGNAGDINIRTDNLTLDNIALISSSTFGQGNAGGITINAHDRIFLNNGAGIFSTVDGAVQGNSGIIDIYTSRLDLKNGALISSSTFSRGNAGNVNIETRDRVSLEDGAGIFSTVGRVAEGDSGNIDIRTGNLTLNNNALISSSTFGRGNAGTVNINVRDRILLEGGSYIRGQIESGGVGDGGNIQIQGRALEATGGSQILAGVFREQRDQQGNLVSGGQGNGGTIYLSISDSILFSGFSTTGFYSGLFTLTDKGASGAAGSIIVQTGNLRLENGALINSSTANSSSGGEIFITAQNFSALSGGQIRTSTIGRGDAGTIRLNVTETTSMTGVDANAPQAIAAFAAYLQSPAGQAELPDSFSTREAVSGIFANTGPGSSGRGGTIQITTGNLNVRDRALVSVSSQGSGIAGNVDIAANRVELRDRAQISAETASVDGGNITLDVKDLLLLRDRSTISTTAGTAQAGGNGGNITINIPNGFIVAVPRENSDITANAFTGRGGNVQITAQGIFGLQFRPQLTPLSDITASSQFGVSGAVNLNTLDVDPSRGLVALPINLADPAQQIAQSCVPRNQASGSFVVTGRGGIPSRPDESLSADALISQWVSFDEGDRTVATSPNSQKPSMSETPQPLEAQTWTISPNGTVQLIAIASSSPAYERSRIGCP